MSKPFESFFSNNIYNGLSISSNFCISLLRYVFHLVTSRITLWHCISNTSNLFLIKDLNYQIFDVYIVIGRVSTLYSLNLNLMLKSLFDQTVLFNFPNEVIASPTRHVKYTVEPSTTLPPPPHPPPPQKKKKKKSHKHFKGFTRNNYSVGV